MQEWERRPRPVRGAQPAVVDRNRPALRIDVTHQRVAEHQSRITFQYRHRGFEIAGFDAIVVCQPFEIPASATLQYEPEVRHRAEIDRIAGITDAAVLAGVVPADLRGPIVRRVVRYYQLKIFECLIDDRANRFLDEVLTVADWNTDADRGYAGMLTAQGSSPGSAGTFVPGRLCPGQEAASGDLVVKSQAVDGARGSFA
jgi:hypothetical protein